MKLISFLFLKLSSSKPNKNNTFFIKNLTPSIWAFIDYYWAFLSQIWLFKDIFLYSGNLHFFRNFKTTYLNSTSKVLSPSFERNSIIFYKHSIGHISDSVCWPELIKMQIEGYIFCCWKNTKVSITLYLYDKEESLSEV